MASATSMTLAITGGTGFVGGHFLDAAVAAGHQLRALTRRPQPDRPGIVWILGSLEDPYSLAQLCRGADAVLHLAGVINPAKLDDFEVQNVGGTANVLAAAREAKVPRLIFVSSLAAREPQLSAYGASKAAAEALFPVAGIATSIVRPPGVYGPGDRETLLLFKMIARGIGLLPGNGRVSFIEVGDLVRALLALLPIQATPIPIEIESLPTGGFTQREMALAIGTAVGRNPLIIVAPKPLLWAVAALGTLAALARRRVPALSFDRARYLSHDDWSVHGDNMAALQVWVPRVELSAGLRATAEWYRAKGWL